MGAGDPYPYQGGSNPFKNMLSLQGEITEEQIHLAELSGTDDPYFEAFFSGTTSIQAADKDGWVVSVTPSGG
jgi:gamma-glutamyltranspeptidase/glutathione hydrolase